MVDDLMVCVDRIIVTSTCFEPVNNGERDRNRSKVVVETTIKDFEVNEGVVSLKEEQGSCSLKKKLEMIECRICQEEDEVHSMEAPCACNGTLKFAHRKCIQRWCNRKGDITCEICNQVFSPNYSVPPPARSNLDVMAIDIRQAWGQHIDLHDSHLLALEHQLLQSEHEDYAVANTSSIACLRSIALIQFVQLLIILLLRQALIVTKDSGIVHESSVFFSVSCIACEYVRPIIGRIVNMPGINAVLLLMQYLRIPFHAKLGGLNIVFYLHLQHKLLTYILDFQFQVSLLQFAGFLLPCYVIARSWYIMQSRRRRHV